MILAVIDFAAADFRVVPQQVADFVTGAAEVLSPDNDPDHLCVAIRCALASRDGPKEKWIACHFTDTSHWRDRMADDAVKSPVEDSENGDNARCRR